MSNVIYNAFEWAREFCLILLVHVEPLTPRARVRADDRLLVNDGLAALAYSMPECVALKAVQAFLDARAG